MQEQQKQIHWQNEDETKTKTTEKKEEENQQRTNTFSALNSVRYTLLFALSGHCVSTNSTHIRETHIYAIEMELFQSDAKLHLQLSNAVCFIFFRNVHCK